MPQEKADNRFHLKVIRDNEGEICPFGFEIPFGCNNAGELVQYLKPATSQELALQNYKILQENNPGEKCFYADKIIDTKKKVICQFPEEQDKIEMPTGSPLYYKPMSGTLMTGLMTFPLGYYNDNSLDRNYYYGYYSIESLSADEGKDLNKKSLKEEFNNAIVKLSNANQIYTHIKTKNSQ